MKVKILPLMLLSIFSLIGCEREKPLTCADISFSLSLTKTDAIQNSANGSITAIAIGGEGITYSIGTNSNSTGIFDKLPAGTYTVVAKNSIGCTQSQSITIESINADNSCTNINIAINASAKPSTPCISANGSLTINAGGSSGFTYRLNNGAFQNSNVFSNLSAGTYNITVRDVNGCSKSQQVTVNAAPPGPNFTNVRNIIRSNCGGCHLNGRNSGGVNYDNDCSIVTGWSRINEECVIRSTMPPGQPLSSNLKAQITAWVNAGHKFTD